MMNETTTTCISILLTVTLVLFLAAVAAFLLVSALNDRRQTAIAARDRRSSADRRAFEQWLLPTVWTILLKPKKSFPANWAGASASLPVGKKGASNWNTTGWTI